jgi:hypothetical protein
VIEFIRRITKLKLERDDNYYWGLILLKIGIVSLFIYLICDLFEPLSFLVTFLICGWGFVLIWKSDNDLRFKNTQEKIASLEKELTESQQLLASLGYRKRYHRWKRRRNIN